jgi:hypothetical protein
MDESGTPAWLVRLTDDGGPPTALYVVRGLDPDAVLILLGCRSIRRLTSADRLGPAERSAGRLVVVGRYGPWTFGCDSRPGDGATAADLLAAWGLETVVAYRCGPSHRALTYYRDGELCFDSRQNRDSPFRDAGTGLRLACAVAGLTFTTQHFRDLRLPLLAGVDAPGRPGGHDAGSAEPR